MIFNHFVFLLSYHAVCLLIMAWSVDIKPGIKTLSPKWWVFKSAVIAFDFFLCFVVVSFIQKPVIYVQFYFFIKTLQDCDGTEVKLFFKFNQTHLLFGDCKGRKKKFNALTYADIIVTESDKLWVIFNFTWIPIHWVCLYLQNESKLMSNVCVHFG